MALTSTPIFQGQNMFIADVQAAADADVGELLINHGLGIAPTVVILTQLFGGAAATMPNYSVTTKSATQVGVTKGAAGAGSANGGAAGVRVIAMRPHSIIQ